MNAFLISVVSALVIMIAITAYHVIPDMKWNKPRTPRQEDPEFRVPPKRGELPAYEEISGGYRPFESSIAALERLERTLDNAQRRLESIGAQNEIEA